MAQHIYRDMAASTFARSLDGSSYLNPVVFFPENQTYGSATHVDAHDGTEAQHSYAAHAGLNSTATMYDCDDEEEELSSQPLLPFVGMQFDTVEDARIFYNEYAFKTGFGIHIGFVLNQVPSVDIGGVKFELFSNYYEDPKIFTVNVEMEQEIFECSCNFFEMNGIICAHIIRVMVHLNVQVIPQCYLLERWSEQATTPTGNSAHLLDFAHPSNNTLKYNSLCRKFTSKKGRLQEQRESQQQQQTPQQNTSQHEQQQPTMQQQHVPHQPRKQQPKQPKTTIEQPEAPNPPVEQDNGESVMLQNPTRVPKKGRPLEKSRRRKTLLEQREDAPKKKAKTEEKKKEVKPRGKPGPKKKKYICSYCKEDGHSAQVCEQL
ncbi:Protein FAR1-RELATED SEQUENCE 5 [Hordeum vulgare]|nr:Protein FAR1-RELATED SEQUENCE 5 [Hordeum vulgare]